MTDRHDVSTTVPWMRQGTAALVAAVDSLSDAEFTKPSLLPGWTRAHVIGHLARNAEALSRLAAWARTGVETPMYANRDQRAAEIERSARHPVSQLRAELTATAAGLDGALAQLTEDGWQAQVRSALGRSIPAAEIPWMRCREVWLHMVDLDNGAGTTDFPPELVDILLDDVTGALSLKDGCPPATLTATERSRAWQLGRREPGHHVRGPAAELVAWLTGRSSGASLDTVSAGPPQLPGWL